MVKIRLLRLPKPVEFRVYRDSELQDMVSPKLLNYLQYHQKADFLCLLAHLLWHYDEENDYAAITKVFKAAVLCFEAQLRKLSTGRAQ